MQHVQRTCKVIIKEWGKGIKMNHLNSPIKLAEKAKHIERLIAIDNATITNIQLRSGEEIVEHHSKNEAIVIVRKGEVRFTVEGKEVIVTPETVLHMAPLEKHDLFAIQDTDLLLIQVKPS